jgi:thioredoxin reductase (NADPH)
MRYDVAVIGAGGAGMMAYLRSVLNHDRVVLFTGDADTKRKGRSTWVYDVDNIPGMHGMKHPIRTSGTATMKWIASQESLKDRGAVLNHSIRKLEKAEDGFVLSYEVKGEAQAVTASYVIVATGVMDVQPEIQGSIQPVFPYANSGHFLYCVRCDGHRTIGHRLAVIGHRDPAVFIAAMMKERYDHEAIYVLTNGQAAAFSSGAMRRAEEDGIEIVESPIQEILGDTKEEGLTGFRLEDRTIQATKAIVSLGVIVYNQLLTQLGADLDDQGKVLVNEAYETSVPDLFAVGDIVSGKKMQIYTAWDMAVDAADEINRRLRRERRRASRSPA